MERNVPIRRLARTLAGMAWQRFKSRVRRAPAQPAPSSPQPAPSSRPATPAVEAAPPAAEPIDVQRLIAETSLETFIARAEDYFSSLTSWTHHLAKPYSTVGDAPALLMNFGTILQGMDLSPGLRVLDFGAGTGWTAHALSQMGCEAVLLEVSPSALEIARKLYEEHPPFGDPPKPEYVLFDGRRIPLPDASVDRILCFDAFHHAPNPEEMIAEFARILRPGGIAAFAEPGPAHSRTAQSQFEMRTYGVLESDVDVEAIWAMAQRHGFRDIRIAAYNIPPLLVDLRGYRELLDAGEMFLRWAETTRAFLENVRNFFLYREGTAPLDSRNRTGLRATIQAPAEIRARAGEPAAIPVTVTNTGPATWLPSSSLIGGVSIGVHLSDATGKLISFDFHWHALEPPEPVPPGATRSATLQLPALGEGVYQIEVDVVANHVSWFSQVGSVPARARLTVE